MRVIAWSANLTQERADAVAQSHGFAQGTYTVVSKHDLFSTSDVLSLHLILSSRSKGIVTAADLALMQATSFLINTSRGPLIDEPALLDILQKGAIRGAGIDVWDVEPLPQSSPWRTTKWGTAGRSIVIRTPHTGYAYDDMLRFMWEKTAENVARVVNGERPLWRLDK